MTNAQIATNLLTYINKYVSYDSDTKTVNIDLQSFVNNAQPQLSTVRAAFTSAVTSTYEGAEAYTLNSAEEIAAAVAVIGEPIDAMLTRLAGVSAADLLGNAQAVGNLLAYYVVQWRAAENYDPVGGLLEQLNGLLTAESQEAIADNINRTIIMPFIQTRGIQTVVDKTADILSNGELDLTGGLVLLPALTDMIDDDSRANIHEIINIITGALRNQLLADGNDLEPNHINIALNGASFSFNPNLASIYVTDLDALGTDSLLPIDASNDTVEAFRILIAGNLDGSEGESLIGSSGNDIIFAGGNDSVLGNGGNDLIIIEDGNSTVETGTITDPNSGFEYTTVTGAIFKDNHTQQAIGISTGGNSTVIGFEGGFELDDGTPDQLTVVDGDINDLAVHFGDYGLTVENGDVSMFFPVVESGSVSVDTQQFDTVRADLLVDGEKFIALNSGNSIAAVDGINHYFLNDDATLIADSAGFTVNGINIFSSVGNDYFLVNHVIIARTPQADYETTRIIHSFELNGDSRSYDTRVVADNAVIDSLNADNEAYLFDGAATINNFTGSTHFNDVAFNTNGNVSIEISKDAPINNEYKSIHSVTGMKAGDTFSVGTFVGADIILRNYAVNSTGTAIERIDDSDSTVVWSGDDVSAVNVMDIYAADVLETKFEGLLQQLKTYISFDGNTVNIDGAGIRSAISTRLNEMKAQLVNIENPTADDVIALLDAALDSRFNLTLADVFSQNTIDNLKARLNADIANNTDIVEGLFNSFGSGMSAFLYQNIINPIINQLGAQISAQDISKIVSDGDSVSEQLMLDTIFNQIFASERAVNIANKVWADFKTRIETHLRADSNSAEHMDVVVNGSTDTLDFGIYIANNGGTIDASNAPFGTNWIFNALDNTLGTYIVGSPYRDMIFADANDTIYSGAGINDRIVLASGSGTININDTIPATVNGIADAFAAYIDSTFFDDAHTREYVGLSSVSSTKAYGFEVAKESNGGLTIDYTNSDVVFLVDGNINDLQYTFDRHELELRNGEGCLRLIGQNTVEGADVSSTSNVPYSTVRADVLIKDGDQLIRTAFINSDQFYSITGAEVYFAGENTSLSAHDFTTVASGNDIILTSEGETVTLKNAATTEGFTLLNVRGHNDSLLELEDNDVRELVTFPEEGGNTVTGFKFGFDESSDVLQLPRIESLELIQTAIEGGALNISVDGENKISIINNELGDSANLLVNLSNMKLHKITAVNANKAIAPTGADVYRLNNETTLTGFTGAAVVQNNVIATDGNLDIVVRYNENHDIDWVDDIVGLSAGNTIAIADVDGSNSTSYSVSADGTSIIRLDTGNVVWAGSADELANVDMQDIDYIEFYADNLANTIYNVISRYVTFDGDTLTIDGATLRTNVAARLTAAREQLGENATADDVISRLEGIISTVFGDELVIGDILNTGAIERLKAQFAEWIAAGVDPFAMLGAQLDVALGDDGLLNFMRGAFVQTAAAERGIQASAVEVTDIYDDNGNVSLTKQLRSVIPSIGSIITSETTTEYFRRGLDRIARNMLARVSAENGEDNYINIVLIGSGGTSQLGLYFTKLAEIGSDSLKPIDASTSTVDNNLIVGNIKGSNNETIVGSNQRDVILAGDGDTVNGGGGNDLIIFADGDVEMTLAQSLTAANFLSSYVEAATFDDAHSQQVVELDSLSAATVVGFETGWSIDGGAVDAINVDNINLLTFDFDDNGLIVTGGAGSILLATDDDAVLPAVNPNAVSNSRTPNSSVSVDLLVNDVKVTAINQGQTLAAGNAEHYFLPEGAVLTNVTGTIDIDDCRFSTSGNLTVNGGTYTFADGTAYWFAAGAYGLQAGDTVSVGDLWSDPTTAKVYRVSDDGTQIIRDEDGSVVYEGDAATLASMNIGPITFADYYGGQIAAGVQNFIAKYISFDGNQLIVNAEALQSDLISGIEGYREELENATAEVAVQRLSYVLDNILGINVALDYILSANVIDNLTARISTAIADGSNAIDAMLDDLDEYSSGVGLYKWIYAKVFVPLQEEYGLQEFGRGFVDVVDENNNFVLSRWLELAKPLLADQFYNEFTGKVLAANIDAVGQYLIDKIRADGGGDGVVNVIFDGDEPAELGVFLTPLDSLGNTVGNIIDASDSGVDTWMFSKTAGDSITGSYQSDFIYVDNAATVNGNGGSDVITFTGDGSRQVLELDTLSAATVVGFETDIDAINVDPNAFFELQVKIDFDDDGLNFTDGDGFLLLDGVNDTVSVNLLVNDQRVTAVNQNQSVEAGDADRYLLGGNATLANFTGAAVVNDVSISASSPISLVALERANRGNRIVNGIFGVSTGDTVQLANSDGNNPITYVVNDDGTEIIRADTGRVVWTGTAEEFAELDFLTVDYQEYYGGIFTAHVEALLDQYVSFDNGTVTVDRKAFRENLAARIDRLTAQLDSDSTVDDALNILVNDLNALFDVDLTEAFSDNVVGAIRTQISNALENGDNPFGAAFGILTSLLSTVASAFWDSSARLGVQTFAADEANIFSGNGSVIENLGLDSLLQDLFNTRSARRMVHNVVTDYRDRFIDEFDDGHLNLIIQSAEQTVNRAFFLGAPDPNVIDTVNADINIIMNSFDGSSPQFLTGTNGDDYFHVGKDDTVYGGKGNDGIIFADGDTSITSAINFNSANPLEITSSQFFDRHSRQTVVIDTDTTATVTGFETGFDDDDTLKSDVLSMVDGNAANLTFEFTDKGLLAHNTGASWDEDGSILLAFDDSGVLPTVNQNAVSDSRTPQPSVNADIFINDEDGLHQARVYVDGNLGSDVELHYIVDNATVQATAASKIVNGGSNVQITGSDGADSVYNNLEVDAPGNVNISAGAGEDYIENGGGSDISIDGGADDDVLLDWSGRNVSMLGADGDDVIMIHDGNSAYVDGGNGHDWIWSDNETNATIDGGGGNDFISITGGSNTIIFRADNGVDSIVGLTAADTISIEGGASFSTVASGNNVQISLDGGLMTVFNANSLDNINIVGADVIDDGDSDADTLIAAGLVDYILHKVDSLSAPALAAEYFHNDYDYDWQPSLSSGSETWTIQSNDGLALNAVHYQPAEATGKWVVLVHGYGGNHTTMREFVDNYLAVGYDVLTVDQRAAGDSEGEWLTMGAAEAADIALWTQEIARREPASKITLHGVSMGAATVMLAAARDDCANLMAVVEDCGYSSAYNLFSQLVPVLTPYPASIMSAVDVMSSIITGHAISEAAPGDAIGNATVPSMFIHGTADTLIAPSNAESLYAASGAQVKTLYMVEGAGHGRSGIDYNEEYGANLFQFLDNNDGSGVIYGYLGDLTLEGSNDADTIVNVGTANYINALDGNDQITLGGTSWTVEGDQTLQSTGNNVFVDAGDGDDSIRSRHSYWTTLLGGEGNDLINVSDGHYMNVDGGNGDDSIIGTRASWGMGGHATLDGGDGNDYIRAGYSNNSSINGGKGNDTIAVDGPNVTIRGGGGNELVSLNADSERTPQGSSNNVIIVDGIFTVDGFDNDDVLIFEDARRDKWVEFTDEGLLLRTDTVISPDVEVESALLLGITDTTLLQFRYGIDADIETEVFIKDGEIYHATLGTADNYVGFNTTAGIDFTGFNEPIDIQLDSTLGSAYFGGINYVKGGDGSTNIVGTAKDETFEIGAGKTTVNGGGGNDQIIGLKDGDFIIIDQNINGSDVVGNALVLTTDDGSVSLTGDSLKGGNSVMIAKGHTIVGSGGLCGIFVNDDGASVIAPNSMLTLDSFVYTIAGDDDGVSISGNSIFGADHGASITFEHGGEYFLNGGRVTIEAGGTLHESELLSGDTMTVDGGEWWFGTDEFGTLIATDARAFIHTESASIAVAPGANTTMQPEAGLTVIDYDPSTRSGFFFDSGAIDFAEGALSLGADNVVRGLDRNEANLFGSGSSLKTIWTGADALIDREGNRHRALLVSTVDDSTVIGGKRDQIDVSRVATNVRFGEGRQTILGFGNDDALYQDEYSDKKFKFTDNGLKFFDRDNSLLLDDVNGSTEVTWKFGNETLRAAYVKGGETYIVENAVDQYVGEKLDCGVDFSAVDDDLNIDATTNFEHIRNVTLGGGNSTFTGNGYNESITAGLGNDVIVLGRGRDTIVNFDVENDRLIVGGEFTVKAKDDDLIVNVDGGKAILADLATVDAAIRIDDRLVKAGSEMSYADGVTDYFGSKNATLTVGEGGVVWLDDPTVHYANIRAIDASDCFDDVTLGGSDANDLLLGGGGTNYFAYSLGGGRDTIANANDDDLVFLLGISLDDIRAIDADDAQVTMQFSDGGRLKLNSAADFDFNINGSHYKLDRNDKRLK